MEIKPVLVGEPHHLLSLLLRRLLTACQDGDLVGVPGVGRLGGVLLGVNSLLVLELLLSSSRLRPEMLLSLFLVLAGLLSGVGDLE